MSPVQEFFKTGNIMSSKTNLEHFLVSDKARDLARNIYRATREHKHNSLDWGLAAQMHRAAVCVVQSLEDGFAQANAPDFHRSMSMAKGSCAEIRSQLHMALDIGYIDQQEFQAMMEQASDIASLLTNLRCPINEAQFA
jgi:four helix bundle protein